MTTNNDWSVPPFVDGDFTGTKSVYNGEIVTVGKRIDMEYMRCQFCDNDNCDVYWADYDKRELIWRPLVLRACQINVTV